jgi:hypothetical protein
MFKLNDPRDPSAKKRVLAVALVILLSPLMAWPIVTTPEAAASAPGPTPGLPQPAGGDYQVRCWQHGRLLFEENHVALPDTAQYGLRVAGKDRNGKPVFVAETKNATCLVRPSAKERNWPR